jgi:hypothetical protein
MVSNPMAKTIEIPIFDTRTFLPNGTRTMDYSDETTLEVFHRNTSATIDVEENKRCVADTTQRIIASADTSKLNTPEHAEYIKHLKILGMEGCIIFNSRNNG